MGYDRIGEGDERKRGGRRRNQCSRCNAMSSVYHKFGRYHGFVLLQVLNNTCVRTFYLILKYNKWFVSFILEKYKFYCFL